MGNERHRDTAAKDPRRSTPSSVTVRLAPCNSPLFNKSLSLYTRFLREFGTLASMSNSFFLTVFTNTLIIIHLLKGCGGCLSKPSSQKIVPTVSPAFAGPTRHVSQSLLTSTGFTAGTAFDGQARGRVRHQGTHARRLEAAGGRALVSRCRTSRVGMSDLM